MQQTTQPKEEPHSAALCAEAGTGLTPLQAARSADLTRKETTMSDTPGKGCMCHAHSESECGCDVDWTPKEVYELKATIVDMEIRHSATMLHTQSIVGEANELREQCSNLDDQVSAAMMVIRGLERQRDRLAEALKRILSYQGRFCEEDPESIAAEALQSLPPKP